MPFLKEHLESQHYSWGNTANTSAYTGMPSRRFFDRTNGEQVLFIINSYASQSGKLSLTEVRKMEELIKYYLPEEARSEMSAFNWLKENYRTPAAVVKPIIQ